MKQLYQICDTENDAKNVVRWLMEDGISAYRQGKNVFVDDGGEDLEL